MEDVIFAGTRERKPTGMAEVSLTLVDPQEDEGSISSIPEIEIQDDIPEDDWDEASVRSTAADATEAAIAEVQPGPLDSPIDEATGEPSVEAASEVATAEANETGETETAAETAENNAHIPHDGHSIMIKNRPR